MPVMRASFFFKDDKGLGWSEILYSNRATLAEVLAQAEALVEARTGVMGTGVSMELIRVSNDEIKRDSRIKVLGARQGKQFSATIGSADIAHTALNLRLEASELKRRVLYLSGIPDSIVDDNGNYKPTPDFRGAIDVYFAALVAGGWCIKSKTGGAGVNVTQILQNPLNGQVTINFGAPHGLLVNQQVNLTGITGCPNLNGLWPIFSVPAPSSVVVVFNQIVQPWTGGGTGKLTTYETLPIVRAMVRGATHRIRGRPFDSARGRRKARKRR